MQEDLETMIYEILMMPPKYGSAYGYSIERLRDALYNKGLKFGTGSILSVVESLIDKGLVKEYSVHTQTTSFSLYTVTTPHEIAQHKLDKRQS